MKAPDTSVLVAAFAGWHEQHEVARRALEGTRLIGHCGLEMLSVLTRLPEPHRVPGELVSEFLGATFPGPVLVLSARDAKSVPDRLVRALVTGGAVYDGLVALTAHAHDGSLVSLDARAAGTYRRLGVPFELLS